jgi:hypothetical protein
MNTVIHNRWAFAPVALLLLSLALCTTGVALALTNADTPEPDYYRKGAEYDAFKQQLLANDALGWIMTPSLVPSTADPRLVRLELTVTDKHNIAIDPAEVAVEIVPFQDASRRLWLTLERTEAGHHSIDVPLRVGGQWEFRVTVCSRGRTYTDTFRRPMTFSKGRSGAS